ncbi:MAG TPA: hypothetical protein VF042_01075 [Gemmatimonadaceae bacterium]
MKRTFRIASALIVISASLAGAQTESPPRDPSEAQMLTVNAAIGAVTAAAWRFVTHKPLLPGAARGAVSGLAAYGGRRMIATSGKPLHWWIGRELSALASSEVMNAARSRPVLERAVIPLGPVRIHVDRSKGLKIVPRIDAVSVVAALVVGLSDDNTFALDESLASGTLAFLAPETSTQVGGNVGAVITISQLAPDGPYYPLESKRRVMAHELVHTAQYDFVFAAWSDPVQELITARSPVVAKVTKYLDFNLTLPFQIGANTMLDYSERPWEMEARALAKHTR